MIESTQHSGVGAKGSLQVSQMTLSDQLARRKDIDCGARLNCDSEGCASTSRESTDRSTDQLIRMIANEIASSMQEEEEISSELPHSMESTVVSNQRNDSDENETHEVEVVFETFPQSPKHENKSVTSNDDSTETTLSPILNLESLEPEAAASLPQIPNLVDASLVAESRLASIPTSSLRASEKTIDSIDSEGSMSYISDDDDDNDDDDDDDDDDDLEFTPSINLKAGNIRPAERVAGKQSAASKSEALHSSSSESEYSSVIDFLANDSDSESHVDSVDSGEAVLEPSNTDLLAFLDSEIVKTRRTKQDLSGTTLQSASCNAAERSSSSTGETRLRSSLVQNLSLYQRMSAVQRILEDVTHSDQEDETTLGRHSRSEQAVGVCSTPLRGISERSLRASFSDDTAAAKKVSAEEEMPRRRCASSDDCILLLGSAAAGEGDVRASSSTIEAVVLGSDLVTANASQSNVVVQRRMLDVDQTALAETRERLADSEVVPGQEPSRNDRRRGLRKMPSLMRLGKANSERTLTKNESPEGRANNSKVVSGLRGEGKDNKESSNSPNSPSLMNLIESGVASSGDRRRGMRKMPSFMRLTRQKSSRALSLGGKNIPDVVDENQTSDDSPQNSKYQKQGQDADEPSVLKSPPQMLCSTEDDWPAKGDVPSTTRVDRRLGLRKMQSLMRLNKAKPDVPLRSEPRKKGNLDLSAIQASGETMALGMRGDQESPSNRFGPPLQGDRRRGLRKMPSFMRRNMRNDDVQQSSSRLMGEKKRGFTLGSRMKGLDPPLRPVRNIGPDLAFQNSTRVNDCARQSSASGDFRSGLVRQHSDPSGLSLESDSDSEVIASQSSLPQSNGPPLRPRRNQSGDMDAILTRMNSSPDLGSSKSAIRSSYTQRTRNMDASVRFENVHVRFYERVLTDNPGCSSGPGMGIGWAYVTMKPLSIESWEKRRKTEPRPVRELQIGRKRRERLLMEWGYDKSEIAANVREINQIKNQRRQTVSNFNARAVEETLEAARRRIHDFQRRIFVLGGGGGGDNDTTN